MKRNPSFARASFVVVVALVVAAAAAPALHAQPACQPFSALIQGTIVLDPVAALPPVLAAHQSEFGWGGTVYGLLGAEKAYLGGWFYGKDDATESIYSRANGRGKDGVYMFAFGTRNGADFAVTDTFTLQLGQAVWTVDQHALAYAGNYKASGTMVDGTGVFEGASGNFTLHGDFAAWLDADPLIAAWNPVLEGSFCK